MEGDDQRCAKPLAYRLKILEREERIKKNASHQNERQIEGSHKGQKQHEKQKNAVRAHQTNAAPDEKRLDVAKLELVHGVRCENATCSEREYGIERIQHG